MDLSGYSKRKTLAPDSGNISSIHLDSLRKGTPDAQRRLYDQYAPKMFALCLRYASSTEEAEDLLQEGFIKIFFSLHQYRGIGSFEGWMRKIFINKAIERFNKKHLYTSEINDRETQSLFCETANSSGFDNLALKDMLNLIQSLSHGYRTVFNLYVIEGFSHSEIAKMLNISESTSKSQLSRAKTILQKILTEGEKVA
jgi:RNA polymerase sigma factor (sigma-70 family)